jgi:hypothetical protein
VCIHYISFNRFANTTNCTINKAIANRVYLTGNLSQTAHAINCKRMFAWSVVILSMRSWYIYDVNLQHSVYFYALKKCYGMASRIALIHEVKDNASVPGGLLEC